MPSDHRNNDNNDNSIDECGVLVYNAIIIGELCLTPSPRCFFQHEKDMFG